VSKADVKCGFLASACSQLSPGTDGQIALRYVNPSTKWTQYTKMMIQPVTFWVTRTRRSRPRISSGS